MASKKRVKKLKEGGRKGGKDCKAAEAVNGGYLELRRSEEKKGRRVCTMQDGRAGSLMAHGNGVASLVLAEGDEALGDWALRASKCVGSCARGGTSGTGEEGDSS